MLPQVMEPHSTSPPAAEPTTSARPLWAAYWAAAAVLLASLAAQATLGANGALLLGAAALVGLGLALWVYALRPLRLSRHEGRRNALLARAMEASREGQLIVDTYGRVIYVNPAYRRIVGAEAEGPAPNLATVFAADPPGLERLARLERAARAGGKDTDRLPLRLASGGLRWVDFAACGLPGTAGLISWQVEDVTASEELREAIKAEQDKLADFLDNAPVGFYSVDSEGRFQFVNGTLARWLGEAPEDLASGRVKLSEVLSFDAASGDAVRGEAELRSRDGEVLPVRVTQSVVRGADGAALTTRSVVYDVTQELAWRKALRQAEEHFRHFFDFAPIGIVVLDEAGRVQEANRAFLAMLGDAPAGAAGRPFVSLIKEQDRAEAAERLAVTGQRGAGGAGAPLEVRFDGAPERVAQLFSSRLEPAAAGVSGLLLHLIETTEQKNLELQFAQSQKMQAVGQLAGGIAHDFNNLLTAMIGFCDLLLLRHQAGDQSFADIMQIKQNANRAANLVRQLLAFSRQQTLRPKVLVITDVLAELSNLLRRLIGETIELKMVHGRDIGLVKVDQGQLEQVIINLVVNARDAMQDGGSLTIRTGNVTAEESTQLGHELMPAGEYVLVEVIDTGRGIPKENLGKIFEPFFTTKEIGAGTGLGLSTVYGIVKQTGGFIFPFSQYGKGATFRIYLPRHRPAPTDAIEAAGEAAERRESRDLTGKGTVLLVEDEDAVRVFAARALRNKGYTVLEASSGEAALAQVESHAGTIDVLISDVVMPHMDGPTLAKQVRASRPDMKIIFISGYAEDAFRRNLDRGADINFLPKPFSLKQLAGTVKEVLGQGAA